MSHCTRISIDLAKTIFQVCVSNYPHQIKSNNKLKRNQLHDYINKFEPCLVVMEACYSSHYWGREFETMGHQVMLIPPQHVKPFVRGNKTDHNDAIAIMEASYRPNLRPVSVKKLYQQDLQILINARELKVRYRTAHINQLRGFLSEYGIIIAPTKIALFNALPLLLEDAANGLTHTARNLIHHYWNDIKQLNESIESLEQELKQHASTQPNYKLIQTIPGIGPIIAANFIASIDVQSFKNGRELSAYLGLTPRTFASGNHSSQTGISKRGNRMLRTLLIHGSRTVMRWSSGKDDALNQWVCSLEKRIGKPKTMVALANKLTRIIWAVLTTKKAFNYPPSPLMYSN